MGFLAPWMLLGSLAASIPLILHFFYRSRYRDVPWAAMKFLLAAMEQTSRRLKFQELLLLLLRVCVLLVLAFALARPTFQGSATGARGDAVDAALVLDASLSMQASAGPGVTCMDRAREAALAVLAQLPAHSTVRVILANGKAEVLGPRNPGHLDAARPLISEVTATERGTGLAEALAEAEAFLAASSSPNKELHIFSDMQKRPIEEQASQVREILARARERATVHFVHCTPRVQRNVAITAITPQAAVRSGERADFAVLVRNAGSVAAKNLTVTLTVNGDEKNAEAQALPEIGPGETRAVVLGGLLPAPGRHILSAAVKPDDLEGDNRLDQVLYLNDQAGVLILDGSSDIRDPRTAASYFLAHAANPTLPGTPGLPVTVLPAERASPRDLLGKELVILTDVRLEPGPRGEPALPSEVTRALGTFVQEGKSLLIIAGPRVVPTSYNTLLFDQARVLPYRLAEKVASAPEDKGWLLARETAEGPYARFRDGKSYEMISRIEVRRAIEPVFDPAEEESRVLVRYGTGKPAIVSRKKAGQGEVLLFTTSLSDAQWSDWQLSTAFVPFVQVTLGHLLESRPDEVNRVAGEPLVHQVPRGAEEAAFDLVPPVGPPRRLDVPAAVRGRHLVTASDTARAGLYFITPAGRLPSPEDPVFAVAPDLRETEGLEVMTPAEIDELIGFKAYHVAGVEGAAQSGAQRLLREWTVWALLILLLLVLAEMALAWHCGRAW
jgi:hypothetical protein